MNEPLEESPEASIDQTRFFIDMKHSSHEVKEKVKEFVEYKWFDMDLVWEGFEETVGKDNLLGKSPTNIAQQFESFVASWSKSDLAQIPQSWQQGDQIHVESLWSVQPDLKNKFL